VQQEDHAVQITALMAPDGPVSQSLFDLFDETNLVEISHSDYPGERLIACRNPALADKRAHNRAVLLAATEASLTLVSAAVTAGRVSKAGPIGIRVGKVFSSYKMAKHFSLTIEDGHFTFTRHGANITAEAALNKIHIIRTSALDASMDTGTVVAT
jgi:hypothetical protein